MQVSARVWIGLAAVFAGGLGVLHGGGPALASAPACTLAADGFNFANLTPPAVSMLIGQIRITCADPQLTASSMTFCVDADVGTGGGDSGGIRYLAASTASGNRVGLQLGYGGNQVLGRAGVSSLPYAPVVVPLKNGVGSAALNLTAKIAIARDAPVGAYRSTIMVSAGVDGSTGDCRAQSVVLLQSVALQAQASIVPTCSITADALDFGNIVLDRDADASAPISVTCTNNTSYLIVIDKGRNASAGVRRMAGHGTNRLHYHFFTDVQRTVPWPAAGLEDKGTGSVQRHMLYARVPKLQGVLAGTYKDQVTVTLQY